MPTNNANDDPVLTREQVREFDRRAIEQLGIPGIVLMENAGRGCVDVLERFGIGGPVVICCGRGNNAGDGLVIARHLDLRGHRVHVVFFSDPDTLGGDARTNFLIARRSGLQIDFITDTVGWATLASLLRRADWIVDALLGTGATPPPRPPVDRVIEMLNLCSAKKMAVDLPSGLDCDTGQPSETTFRADHTCTFVAAKPGLLRPGAQPFVGQLHVLDIGVPRRLVTELLNGGREGSRDPAR